MAIITNITDVKHDTTDIPEVVEVNWDETDQFAVAPPADGETSPKFDSLGVGGVNGTILCRNTTGPKATKTLAGASGTLTVSSRPWGGGTAVDTTFANCVPGQGHTVRIPRGNEGTVAMWAIPFRATAVSLPAT